MPNSTIGLLLISLTIFFVVYQIIRIVSVVRNSKGDTSHFDQMLIVHQARMEIQRKQAQSSPAAASQAEPSPSVATASPCH